MLFQTPKKLFTDAINRGAAALQKSTDPTDPSQYTVLSSDGNSLTMICSGKHIVSRQIIDKAGSDINFGPKFTYACEAAVLKDIFGASNALDKITFNFAASGANDVLKSADPNKQPVGVLGNINILFPDPETWEVPVVDLSSINIPTNPTIELGGTDRLTVSAKTLKKHVTKLGMAVGADDANPAYRNIMLRIKGNVLEAITADRDRMALGKGSLKKSSGDCTFAFPYLHCLEAVNMLDLEQDVEIIWNKGSPGSVVFCQDIIYGDRAIGSFCIRATAPATAIAKIDNVIKDKFSFSTVLKFKTKQAAAICGKLNVPRLPQTMVEVDTTKNLITLTKSEPSRVKMKGVTLPVASVTGEPFVLKFLSPLMTQAILAAENDEIEWGITGPKSLSRMILADDLTIYFPPLPSDN